MSNIYEEAKVITHEEIKEPTIHQQARTDLLNSYGKYFNKQMYAELWNYTLKCEEKEERAKKVEELLGFYRKTTLQGKYEDVMMIAKLEEEMK